jgi:hypothetical protein
MSDIINFVMLIDTREPIAALYLGIAALEWYFSAVSDLKKRRNSPVPLMQVHSEILDQILLFSQITPRDKQPHMAGTPWIDCDSNWVECMRMCHHLRDVALMSPSLWNLLVVLTD